MNPTHPTRLDHHKYADCNSVYLETTCLLRIEVVRPGNLDVCKEMLVPFRGYRRSDPERTVRIDSTSSMNLDVAVGRDRSYGQEKWFASFDCIIKKTPRLLSQDVGGVLPLMADRWVSVALPGAVEIFVGVRIQEEIRARESRRIRCMMILDCMCLEKLASVVRIIPSVLEPYGEISLVQTLAHEFWVASYSGHCQ